MKVIFAATGNFALPCIRLIHKSDFFKIVGIYTQPDSHSGRGRKLRMSDIKKWALEYQYPIYQPKNFKDHLVINEMRNLNSDVLIVSAYGNILPLEVLNIPRFGCINIHPSLLPRWRGASPVEYALLYGDKKSGVTFIKMDLGIDTGDILYRKCCPIFLEDTAYSLGIRLSKLAESMLLDVLNLIIKKKIVTKKQRECYATYSKKIKKIDAIIDWNKSALEIRNKIRALNPKPVAHTHAVLYNNKFNIDYKLLIKIYCADINSNLMSIYGKKPGTIIAINKSWIEVCTGFGSLLIKELQFPGSKVMKVNSWLNSNRFKLYEGLLLE
ncbi:methionyl-tRNA formyltransferase [Candidatus Legionella polyplacis]|uniref:Methionyl-tRNA formyltransferase n=1 Tax=Candidatus Legionella polyplacis TaxID=2005262 RepID=A0ABZ2GYD2_9GAMM